MNQNASNISNDGESDYNTSIPNGEAPDIVELPSPSTTSKIKKCRFSKSKKSYGVISEYQSNTGKNYQRHTSLVDDAILIAKEKLDTVNDVLIERDETAKENKKQTFGREKKKIGEFLTLPKYQAKHPLASRVVATADMMWQWCRIKILAFHCSYIFYNIL